MTPQHEEIRVEIYYRCFGWAPCGGWNSAEEARTANPGLNYREVNPPIKWFTYCPSCGSYSRNKEISERWPNQSRAA